MARTSLHTPTSVWLSCRASGTPQRDSAQCGPVLWLLRTYQSRLWSFWLLITMERKLIWIFLNMTRVFLFTSVSCCSISSLLLVVSPFYEPTIMWEPLPASVGFLQHCQEVVSPVCAAANTDLGVGKFRPQFWRHHSHHPRPLKAHSSQQLERGTWGQLQHSRIGIRRAWPRTSPTRMTPHSSCPVLTGQSLTAPAWWCRMPFLIYSHREAHCTVRNHSTQLSPL